jgi:protein phosphatase
MTNPTAADHHGGRSSFLDVPRDALILLVGIAASGKSTFAARHFAPTEVLSSDAMRAMIADDAHAQGATEDAFDLLHRLLAMRLRRGRLTVVDATNVEAWAREELLAVARRHRRPAVAIVLDLPFDVVAARNAARPAPRPPDAALRRQARWLAESVPAMAEEGFAAVHRLVTPGQVDEVVVRRL